MSSGGEFSSAVCLSHTQKDGHIVTLAGAKRVNKNDLQTSSGHRVA